MIFKTSLIDKVIGYRKVNLRFPRIDPIEHIVTGEHNYKHVENMEVHLKEFSKEAVDYLESIMNENLEKF